MRILLHSNAPWVGTGYGQQTATFAPRIASLGHEVAVSTYHGLQGCSLTWNDLQVHPSGLNQYGNDVLRQRAKDHIGGEPGVVITLCDVWTIEPEVLQDIPAACWFPVDTAPLSTMDREWFKTTGAVPIAMSRHGERMLAEAGFAALYVPHGIDTSGFAPADDRKALRETLNVPSDAFVVGMNAANKGREPSRKAFSQQLEAFAKLRKKHPDAVLLCHTQINSQLGLNLAALVTDLGIGDAVIFPDQYAYTTGELTPAYLAAMYNACDLVTNASYGEGFGLAIVEAQACGTPVVVTDASSMSELCGAGWIVGGDRYWHPVHEAWWRSPSVTELARAYEKAYQGGAERRRVKAREFAVQYDADRVLYDYWKPALEMLEHAVEHRS